MENPRTTPRLPDPACGFRCAVDRWRTAVAALRRWFGMGPRQVPGLPHTRRPQAPRRLILHLHRTVVVEAIEPPGAAPFPTVPTPRRKENTNAQLPPQQS